MPLRAGVIIVAVINITVGVTVFGGFIVLANLGGLLELAASPSWLDLPLSYWPSLLIKALLFSLPTGLTVLLLGLHVKASITVTVLTCLGMYLSAGSYACIGHETRPSNLSGVFDWIVGYENNPANVTFSNKFLRDFAGLALRGLTWTAPSGYALHHMGFGWQYSLSGSVMGLVYYLGSKSPPTLSIFTSHHAYSLYYWGWWVWLVLMISCATQTVQRVHVWIYKKSPYCGLRPFSRWEQLKYDSLNYSLTIVLYEVLIFMFNTLLAASLVFYSLVNQDSDQAKGQTFFCLFSSVLSLAFAQGWAWRGLCLHHRKKGTCWWSRPPLDQFNAPLDRSLNNSHSSNRRSSVDSLLWPYAHPEHSYHERLVLPEGTHTTNMSHDDRISSEDRHVSHIGAAFILFWLEVEKWVWVDIFAWLRHLVGLVSILFTVATIACTITAAILDSGYPRYGGTESTLQ